jgi:WD40 repeat protein
VTSIPSTTDITKTRVAYQWKYDRPLIACRFSPDGKQLISSAEDSTLQRWQVPGGEKSVLKGHESWVHALCFSRDSQNLISGGCEGKLIWWSMAEQEPTIVRQVDAHAGWIRAVEVSPDGNTLVSVGNDKLVKLWNLKTGEKISEWAGHDRHIYSAEFHPNGNLLMTGDLLGKIHVWKLSDGKLDRTIDASPLYAENKGQQAEFGGVRSLSYHAGRNELIAGGTYKASNPFGAVHEPLLLRFSFDDGTLKKSHACEGIPGGMIWRAQWLQDGTAVGVSGGSTGGLVLFFNDAQEKEIHRFKLPSLARDMDIHLDSQLIATAHYDQHVRITAMADPPAGT